jgi:bacterioferritin (cytochrome b1)
VWACSVVGARRVLLEEQTHISLLEPQLTPIKQSGEANWLTQQVRE